MLSDFRLKYILIGRNNKIGTTVLPSTHRSVIIFSLLGKTVVKNRRRRYLNLFCLNKRTECGPSQFGSSRERIAAANAANVQYAGQQRVIIITRRPTLGPRTETSCVIFKKAVVRLV